MKEKKMRLHKINKIVVWFIAGLCLLFLNYLPELESSFEYRKAEGEIVVLFDDDITKEKLEAMLIPYGEEVTLIRHIEDYALLSVRDIGQYQSILERIQSNPLVSAAEANSRIQSFALTKDTYSDSQWALENPGHYIYLSGFEKFRKQSVEDVDMDVPEAWEALSQMELEQNEVVVAVIDTGVDYLHPDLADSMWTNPQETAGDGIDNDNNGFVDDIYGWDFYNNDSSICHYLYSSQYDKNLTNPEDNDDHGTHVAGIIGATADNSLGVAGIASNVNVKLMSLKINGGRDARGSISGAIEAIKYATSMGADVCNMSWGTTQYSAALEQVMLESDMLFVAASGNTGTNNDNVPVYPACLNLDNLISVTFIDAEGKLSGLSNYGVDTVDLAAPGVDIYSTIVGSYAAMSGTSMAAPQVTGIAALLYSSKDHLYAVNVKEIIMQNCKELPDLKDYIKNSGIPSAYKAVMDIESLAPDRIAPSLEFETVYNSSEMIVPVFVEDFGDSHLRVVKWFSGKKKATDFGRGTNGNIVVGNQITVSKEGVYSFYAADYAGNETVKSYEVKQDTKAPKLTATYTVASNYKTRTVTIKVSDKQSGVKRVEYMPGIKKANEFLPATAGIPIELTDGTGTFKVKKDGTYTIFASDYRGNMKIATVVVKTVKATEIKFTASKKTVTAGDKFTWKAFVKPANTTDRISYTSSDKSIVTITSKGTVKAIAEGKAYLTAKTSSGLKTVSEIIVKPQIDSSE